MGIMYISAKKIYRMVEIVFFFWIFIIVPLLIVFFKLRDHKSRKDKKSELFRPV